LLLLGGDQHDDPVDQIEDQTAPMSTATIVPMMVRY